MYRRGPQQIFWLLFLLAFLACGCSSRQPASGGGWYEGTELDGASSGTWIQRLNHYRSMAAVGPVSEDPTLSAGDQSHARYVVKNFEASHACGGLVHAEARSNRWYSAQGDRAAHHGDVAIRQMGGGSGAVDAHAIDEWMIGPFHRVEMLDPNLVGAGWGAYAEGGVSAAVMEVRHETARSRSHRRIARAVAFPPPGGSIAFSRYPGGEWPDPLSACGYSAPSGVPITIQFENRTVPVIESYAVSENGTALESCAYTASTFRAPDRMQQLSGSHALRDHSALVIIPRAPMRYGRTYAVNATVNRHPYRWTFSIERPPGAPSLQLTEQNLPPY